MELAFRKWGGTESQSGTPSDRNTSEKPRLLLLHGMGGTGALWRPIAAILEDDFEILAPDQRGHGGSQIVPDLEVSSEFSPETFAQDVLDTLQKTGFYPCFVVGHSMGARTACAFAGLKPEWVRGVVLVDLGLDGLAGGGLGEQLSQFIRILPEHFKSREEARNFMNAHCPDPSIAQYLLAVATLAPPQQGGGVRFPFDHRALLQTIDAARGYSLRPCILKAAQRGIPVLALRGEHSKVWLKPDFERDRAHFESGFPIQFEEISGAGHGLPFEKRSDFVERLRRFTR